MNKEKLRVLVFCFGVAILINCLPVGIHAQVKGVFYGIDFNHSVASVKTKLSKHCGSTTVISIESPNFPLAKDSEQHLICEEIKLGEDLIKEVIFAFGDDKLFLIEARGGAVKALIGKATDEAMTYIHYQVYFTDLMVADTKEDAVWLLSKDSLHPNLFVWSNPYLPSNKGEKTRYTKSAKNPKLLKFGARLTDISTEFENQCPIIKVETISKPWLPTKPKTQTQINCFGFEYAGFPRKIEAVFGDGVLELAWILTGKGEVGRVRKALIAEYGKPEFVNEAWEAFNGWQIALRKDKPEVLVLSEKLAIVYKARYENKK